MKKVASVGDVAELVLLLQTFEPRGAIIIVPDYRLPIFIKLVSWH